MTARERPFTVADGMTFVAATAVGLAGGLVPFSGPRLPTGWHYEPVVGSVWLAASLTSATLAARLKRPRPRWRSITREPGFVASVAVISTAVLSAFGLAEGLFASVLERGMNVPAERLFWNVGSSLTFNARYAVAASWTVQAISGRWRPARSWVDRLGLALGGYWLAAPTLKQMTRLLWKFFLLLEL